MIGLKSGSLAGLMALTTVAAPATAFPQDGNQLLRAFEVVGRGAQIGATVTEVDGDDRQPKAGVIVETVTPDGPAARAGIKAGDAIAEFDGERVRSVLQFSRLVQETPPGRSVPATLLRGGQRVTVTVTPDRRQWSDDFSARLLDLPRAARITPPSPPAAPSAPRAPRPLSRLAPGSGFDVPGLRFATGVRLGITIESIDDQLAEYFGVKEGVLVKSVLDRSSAQKAGLKAGDVITAINGSRIYETADVNRALDRIETGAAFTIDVVRDKKPQQVKGTLEAPESRTKTRVRTIL